MTHIAIDGPGGAGKSSVAKLLASQLKFIYVDTGALYRAVGYYMVSHGISPHDTENVISALPNVKISLKFTDRQELYLCGEDVGDKIRTPEISMAASTVSAIPEVRAFLLETQRSIAKTNNVIMDGRDIGTVILPKANLKIFHGKYDSVVPVTQSLTLFADLMAMDPKARIFLDIFDGGHRMDMAQAMYWLLSQYQIHYNRTYCNGSEKCS